MTEELKPDVEEGQVYRISPKNINSIKFKTPQKFDHILFDSNLSCNLHCVYCHNDRTTNTVSEEDFLKFINTQISSVKNFQIGCAMEPTMDKRMTKFALMISKSHANPTGMFRLQTNGILIHRHKIDEMKEAKINRITISIDTIDENIHRELRGGSDLKQILKNINDLKKQWPSVNVHFITTVTSRNINGIFDLVKYATDIGINLVELRKMFYFPDSKIIKDHFKMKELMVSDEEFDNSSTKVLEKFGNQIEIYVNDSELMEKHRLKQKI